MPAEVGPGDEVIGSCVSMSGRLVVRASRVGADTLLAQITRLVSQAQMSKAAAQRLADRIAAIFVPSVISLAAATLGFWLGAGLSGAAAWSAAIAVLVVACPCALGLATPTALLAGVGRGAELGILVKSVHALESAQRIRIVVLDKTGTLTSGTMTVQDVITTPGEGDAPGADEKEVLLLAGAVEDASEHPIGQAIAREAAARLGGLPPVTGFTSLPGAGVRGTVTGRAVTIGSPQFLGEQGLAIAAGFADRRGGRGKRRADGRAGRLGRPGAGRPGRRGRAQAGRAGRGGPPPAPGPAAGAAHRGQRADGAGGRRPAGHSDPAVWSRASGRTGRPRSSASSRKPAAGWPWSAMASTTRPPWPRPTWAWR